MEPERLSHFTQQQLQNAGVGDLMRYLSCSATAHGAGLRAMELFLEKYPRAVHASVVRKQLDGFTTKAAVAPGTTTTVDSAAS